jgi:Cu2+-exporting ATPase
VPALAEVREHPGAGLSAASPEGELRLGSRSFCNVGAGEDDGMPELYLDRPGKKPARFVFADTLRSDAATVVAQLQRQGKRVVLLSGDRAPVVARTAAALGIEEWRGGVGPDAKCAALAALAADGYKTLMVGDGLNDAPALAAAYVSMSPATAADVSQTAADMVFQRASLGAVVQALDVARRSGRLVRQNIAFAVAYNALAVPLAMLGWATPLVAAIAMSTSSLLVVGNALRLWRETA